MSTTFTYQMAFGGDVDTLSLTFDKLQYIFNGYDQIRDSFLEANSAYKQGKFPGNFFDKIQEGVMRFSALEFLAIKSIFEIKKSIDKSSGIAKNDNDVNASIDLSTPPTSHSIASFIVAGVLPTPNHTSSQKKQNEVNCPQCINLIKKNAKFCTNCGIKL